jgi:asparagine synthase (glutamine-hydrolysing)
MRGRLPDAVIDNRKIGIQAADWYPRLSRERHQIREAISGLAEDDAVASIVDCGRLTRVLDRWPAAEPLQASEDGLLMAYALPQALGAAMFIKGVAVRNTSYESTKF